MSFNGTLIWLVYLKTDFVNFRINASIYYNLLLDFHSSAGQKPDADFLINNKEDLGREIDAKKVD